MIGRFRLPRIVRPGSGIHVCTFGFCLPRTRYIRTKADRNRIQTQKILFDRDRACFIIFILIIIGFVYQCRRRQIIGSRQNIVLQITIFFVQQPIILLGIRRRKDNSVRFVSFLDDAVFPFIFKSFVSTLHNRTDSGRKSMRRQKGTAAAIYIIRGKLSGILFIDTVPAFAILRAVRIIQKDIGKENKLFFRKVQRFPRIRIIVQHPA